MVVGSFKKSGIKTLVPELAEILRKHFPREFKSIVDEQKLADGIRSLKTHRAHRGNEAWILIQESGLPKLYEWYEERSARAMNGESRNYRFVELSAAILEQARADYMAGDDEVKAEVLRFVNGKLGKALTLDEQKSFVASLR